MIYDLVITSLPGLDKAKPVPGPAFIKGYLEPLGYKVKVIDGNQLDTLENIHKEIAKYQFKWLGISVFSFLQKDDALKLAEPYDNVVFGGSGVDKNWPRKHFIRGEEHALKAFMEGNLDFPGINGKEPTQMEDIEHLPPPDYSDVVHKHNYTRAVISGSRGCVRKCTFCDVMSIWPKYRWKTGKKIADDLHHVSEQTGLKKINFSDSLINGSMKHFRDLCHELAKRPKKINWDAQFIVRDKKTFTQQDFDNLANSGCVGLDMGIESGSERVRDHMKKKFSNDDIEYFITNIGERNIRMKFLLICGYPTETEKDFEETLNLLRKYKKYAHNIFVSHHIMITFQNTPLDFEHRDLFNSEFGYHWKNENSDFEIRFNRFMKVLKLGQELGYQFQHHALDKVKQYQQDLDKLNKHNNIAVQS
jgi:radical SAM superfamily enzyme YgiQ (UPF0313 family)